MFVYCSHQMACFSSKWNSTFTTAEEDDVENLIALRKAAEDAHTAYQYVGMQNTNGRSPEDRVALDIAYRQAESRWMTAQMRYELAVSAAAQA